MSEEADGIRLLGEAISDRPTERVGAVTTAYAHLDTVLRDGGSAHDSGSRETQRRFVDRCRDAARRYDVPVEPHLPLAVRIRNRIAHEKLVPSRGEALISVETFLSQYQAIADAQRTAAEIAAEIRNNAILGKFTVVKRPDGRRLVTEVVELARQLGMETGVMLTWLRSHGFEYAGPQARIPHFDADRIKRLIYRERLRPSALSASSAVAVAARRGKARNPTED